MRVSSVSSGWNAVARILPWRKPTTLPSTDRFDGGGRSDFGHERPADEHQREIFEHDVGRGVLRNMLARCDHDGGITGRGAEIGGGGERAKLAAVCVAPHDGVKRAEVDVVVVIELAGQQNHAGAGTEHRFAGGDMLCNRLEQAGGAQQLALRGALAARAESPGRSNRRNPRPRAAASTARRGDPAWAACSANAPCTARCRSRHVSRLRRRPILPSKCIQLLQPLPFLCFRMCRLRGASRCPRSRRHACAVRAVTRHGRP